jgi:hypothetical protein
MRILISFFFACGAVLLARGDGSFPIGLNLGVLGGSQWSNSLGVNLDPISNYVCEDVL